MDVPLPDGLSAGDYTLYVFNECLNGDKLSDFSSELSAIELTVTALEYLDEDGETKALDSVATFLDSDAGQWGTGWYAAAGNVEIDERVQVTGDAKLILTDGAALHIPKGITVPTGSFTPRNFWNAKYISATITTMVISVNRGGTFRYRRTAAMNSTVEM